MVSKNFEVNIVGVGMWQGTEESRIFLSNLFEGFADLSITPVTVLYDDYAYRFIISEIKVEGHQLGRWNGNPSRGKKFSTMGAISIKFDKSAHVKRIVVYLNFASIYKQLEILKI
jgi:hypothetical protein